jgi:hypothetical protein
VNERIFLISTNERFWRFCPSSLRSMDFGNSDVKLGFSLVKIKFRCAGMWSMHSVSSAEISQLQVS